MLGKQLFDEGDLHYNACKNCEEEGRRTPSEYLIAKTVEREPIKRRWWARALLPPRGKHTD